MLYNKKGMVNLSIAIIAQFIKDKDPYTSEFILQLSELVEKETGITIKWMREQLSSTYIFDEALFLKDAETMTVKELAEKWHKTDSSVRCLLMRRNIDYCKTKRGRKNVG